MAGRPTVDIRFSLDTRILRTVTRAVRRERIRLTSARRDPATARRFLARQSEIYAGFGVTSIPACSSGTHHDPATLMIVCESASGELLGGIRIHRRTTENRLPVEHSIADRFPALPGRVDGMITEGVAELSGLWVAPERRRTGLSVALIARAIETATMLGITRICAFAHQYSAPIFRSAGFRNDPEILDLSYPIPRYLSGLLWLDPSEGVAPGVEIDDREVISLSIR